MLCGMQHTDTNEKAKADAPCRDEAEETFSKFNEFMGSKWQSADKKKKRSEELGRLAAKSCGENLCWYD